MIAITPTEVDGVLVLQPQVFRDPRGSFTELYRADRYAALGVDGPFVQDNSTVSGRNVLRGLHFQVPRGQGKLIQVLDGVIWDVALDVRRGSPTFGRWLALELGADSGKQLWLPAGFAHGFCVLSESAVVLYKCTAYHEPAGDRAVRWDDPDLAIPWPIAAPLLSARDAAAPRLRDLTDLPLYASGGG